MHPFQNPDLSIIERVENLITLMTVEEKASQLLYASPAIPRLGIPAYNWWNEALHGVARAGRATIFPQTIGLAASFDEAFIEKVFTAVSDEARAKHHQALHQGNHGQYRGLTYWTPNINIYRDPRWGRGQETYGEDPVLTSRLGSAVVRGLQGHDKQYLKLAACAKHYAVHSGPEGDRHGFDARVSQKDLRETYLPAFKALVEAGVESIMGAYNRTNGEVCCASPTLIGKILRGEWGFKGHFVSDCWAIRDFHEHHKVTNSMEESAALALKEGCDINCGCSFEMLIPAYRKKLVADEDFDKALRHSLTSRFKLGMFDPEDRVPYASIPMEVVDSAPHRDLAREAAVRSAVLLKNNGLLPLSKNLSSLYVTGPNAAGILPLMGNYYGLNGRLVTFLEGIAAKVGETTNIDYRPGCLVDRIAPNPVEWALFEAGKNEVTVAFLGYDPSLEGEEGDALASEHIGDRADIALPENQLEFLKKLRSSAKKLIVVLSGGGAVSFPSELADAIIMAWYPGEEGGTALADILFGDSAPSGKLPVTFYKDIKDLPPYEDYAMKGRTYRYFDKEVLYPFGFGLTYTSFELSEGTVSSSTIKETQSLKITAKIKNTGTREGTETLQVYVHAPKTTYATPLYSLRDFSRVSVAAGVSKEISFTLNKNAFYVVDETGKSVWLQGKCKVWLAASSPSRQSETLGSCAPLDFDIELV